MSPTASPSAATGPTRAVLFDLDGTLYHQGPVRRGMLLALATHLALSPRRGLATVRGLRAYRAAREELRAAGHAAEPLDELQYVAPAALARLTPAALRALVEEWMVQRPLPLLARAARAELLPTLDALARRGLSLGVYSDYPVEHKLEALGCRGRFDVTLCSTDPEVNACKPHPRGFLVACERWGLAPEEVLYVGDRADVDARGALAAGMACALVGAPQAPDGVPRLASLRELEALLAARGER